MTATAPPAQATNGELVRWAFDVLNERSVEPLRRFWTAETVERFPDATCVGTDAIAAYFEAVFAALPDVRMEVLSLAEQGEDVFVQWRLTGTHTGAPFQGIDATGKHVELDGIDHFVVRDGNVVSNFVVFDQMQFARAIGMLPEQDTRADKTVKAAFNARTKLLRRRRR